MTEYSYTNINATTAQFPVDAGMYVMDYVAGAWNGASAYLQGVGPDGATLLTQGSSFTANGHQQLLALGSGQYQFTVTGSPTNLDVRLRRVPQ